MSEPADPALAPDAPPTLYRFVGGREWFVSLVARFYAGVAVDPVLRPLYPEEDLVGACERLTGFLVQYWGGPDDYSRERGHPRLRMRHMPYSIGQLERDRWLFHMSAALREARLPSEVEEVVLRYFEDSSTAMINRIGGGSNDGNT